MGISGGIREYDSEEEITGIQGDTRSRLNNTPRIEYETKAEIRKKEMKENAKQPLNSICQCGSGKKYKSCCIKKHN